MFFFFFTSALFFFFGYIYGHYIKPNKRLRQEIIKVKEKFTSAMEEGRTGIYKTIVTDQKSSSELIVEVKELAVTQNGQVKVLYLSAHYRNPEFRTKKGDALLKEVYNLLGEYLPENEIEWYDQARRHESFQQHIQSLDKAFNYSYRKF